MPRVALIAVIVAFGGLTGSLSGCAAQAPPPAPTTIALWPGAVPDSWPVHGPEYVMTVRRPLAVRRPWTAVGRVSHPTLTLYPARVPRTRAAVIVFPGGGYEELAIDLEGTEVCDWLTPRGIACVVVK